MSKQRPSPPVGGTIEDETGWWQVTHVEAGWAWLLGRDGTERQVRLENLGAVAPPPAPLPADVDPYADLAAVYWHTTSAERVRELAKVRFSGQDPSNR